MNDEPNKYNWTKLLVAAGVLTAVWVGLLPVLARQPRVAERIRRLEQQGIDPSAIYYSELDAMPDYEARIQRIRRDQPEAF